MYITEKFVICLSLPPSYSRPLKSPSRASHFKNVGQGSPNYGPPNVISKQLNAMVYSDTEINIKNLVIRPQEMYQCFLFSVFDYDFSQCITERSANDSLQ